MKENEKAEQQSPPLNHAQAANQKFLADMKDLGYTVKEIAPSRTGKLVATFVPRRAEPTSPAAESPVVPSQNASAE